MVRSLLLILFSVGVTGASIATISAADAARAGLGRLVHGLIMEDEDAERKAAAKAGEEATKNLVDHVRKGQKDETKAKEAAAKAEAKAEKKREYWELEIGAPNADGLVDLIAGKHADAEAHFTRGLSLENRKHKRASHWLLAVSAADQGQDDEETRQLEALVADDPKVEDLTMARKEMKGLMKKLRELRQGKD